MTPYISIIAASRNDNHGDNMAKRMRMFVNGLIIQTNKYRLPVELIIVEWNPPAGKLLNEILPAPQKGDFLSIRYIIVPPEIHQQYRLADTMPLYQMTAKNIGLRRAKADFILCTNVDVLFANDLMEILAKRNLNKNDFYRANRCDVPASIDEALSMEEQLKFCKENVIRRLGRNYELVNMETVPTWVFSYRPLALALHKYFTWRRKRRLSKLEYETFNLDTKACGDFTMMHRDAWEPIQGYPELDLYSVHIDSMAIIAARACGYNQNIFPPDACLYHIDHYSSWESIASMSVVEQLIFVNTKPGIGWDFVSEIAKRLIADKDTYNFNKDDWGFANHSFSEIAVNPFE